MKHDPSQFPRYPSFPTGDYGASYRINVPVVAFHEPDLHSMDTNWQLGTRQPVARAIAKEVAAELCGELTLLGTESGDLLLRFRVERPNWGASWRGRNYLAALEQRRYYWWFFWQMPHRDTVMFLVDAFGCHHPVTSPGEPAQALSQHPQLQVEKTESGGVVWCARLTGVLGGRGLQGRMQCGIGLNDEVPRAFWSPVEHYHWGRSIGEEAGEVIIGGESIVIDLESMTSNPPYLSGKSSEEVLIGESGSQQLHSKNGAFQFHTSMNHEAYCEYRIENTHCRWYRRYRAADWSASPVSGKMLKVADDFPDFIIPGHESEAESLRRLYWMHYANPTAATLDGNCLEQELFSSLKPHASTWMEWLSVPHLWPATSALDQARKNWRHSLESHFIDSDGFVASDINRAGNYAHIDGWPFPVWSHGDRGIGWHFAYGSDGMRDDCPNTLYRPPRCADVQDWQLTGVNSSELTSSGWSLSGSNMTLTSPEIDLSIDQAPFWQLRWFRCGGNKVPASLQWRRQEDAEFSSEREVALPGPEEHVEVRMVKMYHHPLWNQDIRQIRLKIHSDAARVVLEGLCSAMDTRHSTGNAAFVQGAIQYFFWSGDRDFLAGNQERIRRAFDYVLSDLSLAEEGVICCRWPGHDGRPGRRPGHGIGSNYWDIFSFGGFDAYATIQAYGMLKKMEELERYLSCRNDLAIPPPKWNSEQIHALSVRVFQRFNELFWNAANGRFIGWIDDLGHRHDYGFTTLNAEALSMGLATEEHAAEVLSWLNAERTIPGDEIRSDEIYRWRFAPISSTKENYEAWFFTYGNWIHPREELIQEGGAILGFSYFDILARLRYGSPEMGARRLLEIARWYAEVATAGGYEHYYRYQNGTLQACGNPGGLGLVAEFLESIKPATVLLTGFLGFTALADGFSLNPALPADWPQLCIDRIAWHNCVLNIQVTRDEVVMELYNLTEPITVCLPDSWDGLRHLEPKPYQQLRWSRRQVEVA